MIWCCVHHSLWQHQTSFLTPCIPASMDLLGALPNPGRSCFAAGIVFLWWGSLGMTHDLPAVSAGNGTCPLLDMGLPVGYPKMARKPTGSSSVSLLKWQYWGFTPFSDRTLFRYFTFLLIYPTICIYEYIWVYMSIYEYIWVYMSIYEYIWVYMSIYEYMYICIYVYMYIYKYTNIYKYICICVFVYLCIGVYVYMCYIYIFPNEEWLVCSMQVYVYVYVHMYICICICYIYIYMYVYMYMYISQLLSPLYKYPHYSTYHQVFPIYPHNSIPSIPQISQRYPIKISHTNP